MGHSNINEIYTNVSNDKTIVIRITLFFIINQVCTMRTILVKTLKTKN